MLSGASLMKTLRFSLKFHSARLTADSDKLARMPLPLAMTCAALCVAMVEGKP